MKEKIQKIANYYGREKQQRKLMGECAELIQALNKHCDYDEEFNLCPKEYDWKYFQDVVGEIADVQVMIAQIKFLLNISDDAVNEVMKFKVDRQLERIAQKEGK